MISINLTTTSQRLNLCRIALVSLTLQSRQADRINLWVSREPYLRDNGISDESKLLAVIESLPTEARRLVKIHWVDNIGPYRKLIPTLKEASKDEIIVTADDDIFYGQNWLEHLLDAHEQTNGNVVAAGVRQRRSNFLGQETSYTYWKMLEVDGLIVKDHFVVTFGAGTVLKKTMFRESDIYNEDFLTICPTTDDIWFSQLLINNQNHVYCAANAHTEVYPVKHTDGLINENLPKTATFFKKVRAQTLDKVLGYLGFSICGNDVAYKKIQGYLKQK